MREGMGNPGQSFPWPYGYLHLKKNPRQVSLPSYFCIPFQITPSQKMTEDLKDLNLDGSSADKLLHIGKKENKDIVKIYGLVYKSCNKQN